MKKKLLKSGDEFVRKQNKKTFKIDILVKII